MAVPAYYGVAGVALFLIGLYAVITRREPFRKILALNIMSSGVFLFLVAAAFRGTGAMPDPVPHALVLTGIVVSISATALGLWLVVESRRDRRDDARP